jgi:hypothetical protein
MGDSWTFDQSGTTEKLNKIYFVNDTVGFVHALVNGNVYGINFFRTGISEIQKNTLSVYPNPSSGLVTIEINDNVSYEKVYVELSDITGKIVFQSNMQTIGNKVFSDFGFLSNGMYLMKTEYSKGVFQNKIIVQKVTR